RPAHPLGLALVLGRDVVQLAPAARAAGDPRLRRRARGRPHRGDGPLGALLAAARVALPALARACRLVEALRHDPDPLSPALGEPAAPDGELDGVAARFDADRDDPRPGAGPDQPAGDALALGHD